MNKVDNFNIVAFLYVALFRERYTQLTVMMTTRYSSSSCNTNTIQTGHRQEEGGREVVGEKKKKKKEREMDTIF